MIHRATGKANAKLNEVLQAAEAVQRVLLSSKVNYWVGQEGREFEREYAGFFLEPGSSSMLRRGFWAWIDRIPRQLSSGMYQLPAGKVSRMVARALRCGESFFNLTDLHVVPWTRVCESDLVNVCASHFLRAYVRKNKILEGCGDGG